MEGMDNKIFDMMVFKERTGCKNCAGLAQLINTKTGLAMNCAACQGTGTAPVPFCEAEDA